MENILISLGLIILTTILFLIWNDYKLLMKFMSFKKDSYVATISDQKYYELNYKIQLIIASTSIIVVVGGYLGYNSIHTVNQEIDNSLSKYREKLQKYDSTIVKYNILISQLDSERVKVSDALIGSLNETQRLKGELIKLQREFSPNIKTYIIKDINYDPNKDESTRIYYKDLLTIDGSKLPLFNEPPILNVLDYGNSNISISKNTPEYFEYSLSSYLEIDEKAGSIKPMHSFDLIITKYK